MGMVIFIYLTVNLEKIFIKCLNDSLKIQLAQFYGQGKSQLRVKIPYVQQQNNGHNCGLFAIANMMEFVTSRYKGYNKAG